jgi:hypothetical protein
VANVRQVEIDDATRRGWRARHLGRRNREERRLPACGDADQFLKRGINTAAAKSIEE